MTHKTRLRPGRLNKREIRDAIDFIRRYVPAMDEATLEQLLVAVAIGGTSGTARTIDLVDTMNFMLANIPDTCVDSLLTVTELLQISVVVGRRNDRPQLILQLPPPSNQNQLAA